MDYFKVHPHVTQTKDQDVILGLWCGPLISDTAADQLLPFGGKLPNESIMNEQPRGHEL